MRIEYVIEVFSCELSLQLEHMVKHYTLGSVGAVLEEIIDDLISYSLLM